MSNQFDSYEVQEDDDGCLCIFDKAISKQLPMSLVAELLNRNELALQWAEKVVKSTHEMAMSGSDVLADRAAISSLKARLKYRYQRTTKQLLHQRFEAADKMLEAIRLHKTGRMSWADANEAGDRYLHAKIEHEASKP